MSALIGNTKPGRSIPVLMVDSTNDDEVMGVNAIGRGGANSPPQPRIRRLLVSPRLYDPAKEHIKSWLKHYDQIAKANGWDEDTQLEQLPVWVTGTAAKYLTSQPDYTTFDEAKKALKSLFSAKGDDADFEAVCNFKQTPDMSVRDYVVGKLEKIVHWKPACDEPEKVALIRRGLLNRYRAELHYTSIDTVPKLLRKVILLEEAHHIRDRGDDTEMVLAAEPVKQDRAVDMQKQRRRVGECWTCGALDHYNSSCPKRECFYCKKTGHLHRDCWKRRQDEEQRPPYRGRREDDRKENFQSKRVTYKPAPNVRN